MSFTTAFQGHWFTEADADHRRPARAWHAIADRVRRAMAIRRYRAILEEMSDATLADIGICRDNIDRAVRAHLDEAGRPCGGYPFAEDAMR